MLPRALPSCKQPGILRVPDSSRNSRGTLFRRAAILALVWPAAAGCAAPEIANGDPPAPGVPASIEERAAPGEAARLADGNPETEADNRPGADERDDADDHPDALPKTPGAETEPERPVPENPTDELRSPDYTLKNPTFIAASGENQQVMTGEHFHATGSLAGGFSPAVDPEPEPKSRPGASTVEPRVPFEPPASAPRPSSGATAHKEPSAPVLLARNIFLAPLLLCALSLIGARNSPLAAFWKRMALGFGAASAALALIPLGEALGVWTL